MAYSSRCSGRTADALRDAGWGMLLAPGSRPPRPYPGMPWCLDNGAWTAHTQGTPWDDAGFRRLVSEWGVGADWIAAPDIVMGGDESLRRSLSWLDELMPLGVVLVPVQDGMTADDLRPHVGPRVGIFVGGSAVWKEASLPMWGSLCADRGAHLHVARVNSARRIALCAAVGAHSIDGSSVSRFRATLPRLDAARRQLSLLRPSR